MKEGAREGGNKQEERKSRREGLSLSTQETSSYGECCLFLFRNLQHFFYFGRGLELKYTYEMNKNI